MKSICNSKLKVLISSKCCQLKFLLHLITLIMFNHVQLQFSIVTLCASKQKRSALLLVLHHCKLSAQLTVCCLSQTLQDPSAHQLITAIS